MSLYVCPDHTISRLNPNGNYDLWVIMMCQGCFINCSKCMTLVGDTDNRECLGAGDIWEISVPSSQFCSEPKTALKNKSIQHC